MDDNDRAERQRYARKPLPARPKGAIAEPGGIQPVNGPTPPPIEMVPGHAPHFDFAQDVEEPRRPPDISATVDETGAFHIFSLIVKALRKVDKPTRRRIIGLINELELGE